MCWTLIAHKNVGRYLISKGSKCIGLKASNKWWHNLKFEAFKAEREYSLHTPD